MTPEEPNLTLTQTITGENLLLRRVKLSDAETIYRLINNKAVSRWLMAVPHPYPRELAERFIRQKRRQWTGKKAFVFAIVRRDTEELIGVGGLHKVDFTHSGAEIGYWLGKKHWGRGLGTEAVRLLLEFGFRELKLYRIYGMTFGPNTASQRVMEKCGFTLEGTWRKGIVKHRSRRDLVHYGILRDEYR